MLQHSSDLWQGISFLHGITGPCLHLGLLQVLKIALPTPVYPPCLSVDFCVLYSSLTGNTWCCASLLAALKDPMQEQWPLHPGMHRRHLDISAGVSSGCSGLKGLLWSHSQSVAVPEILLGQKSSPHSRAEGVKASLTVLLVCFCCSAHRSISWEPWGSGSSSTFCHAVSP